MSSESEHEPTAPPASKIASFLWVLIPALLILAGLAALFNMTP